MVSVLPCCFLLNVFNLTNVKCDVRWLMDQVDGKVLSELLCESSIYSSRCASHPLFEHLTSLTISESNKNTFKDARVISYVLAHARQLKKLSLAVSLLKMDDAFTRQLIGAPLEKLEIFDGSGITDVTIDVLCQQLAASLRSLTLYKCDGISRTGFNKVIGEDIDVHCI